LLLVVGRISGLVSLLPPSCCAWWHSCCSLGFRVIGVLLSVHHDLKNCLLSVSTFLDAWKLPLTWRRSSGTDFMQNGVLCSDSPAKYPKFCSCVTLPGAREMPEGKEGGNSHFEMPAHSCWNITGYKVSSICTATKTEHMEEEHVLCFLKYPTYARKDYRPQCAPPLHYKNPPRPSHLGSKHTTLQSGAFFNRQLLASCTIVQGQLQHMSVK
jgi:hypothetical protein